MGPINETAQSSTNQYRQELLELLASGKGMPGLLEAFCRWFTIRAVLTDDIFMPLAVKGGYASNRNTELIDVLDGSPSIILDRRMQFQWEAKRLTLEAGGETCGYLYVDLVQYADLNHSDLDDILPDFAMALKVEQNKNRELLLQGRRWKNAFLFDLLYGNVKDENSVRSYAKTWEWDLTIPHTILSFQLQDYDLHLGDEHLLERIERQWETHLVMRLTQAMILQKRDELIVFLPVKHPENVREREVEVRSLIDGLLHAVSDLLKGRVLYTGVGRTYQKGIDFFRSYQEAKMARDIGIHETKEHISFFKDIGLLKILYSHDPSELAEFYHDTMDILNNHDQETEADLTVALKAYVANNMDISKTAKAIFVHRNTIRYRLRKIEELLQTDLNDLTVVMNFVVAFHIESLNRVDLFERRR